MGKSSGQAFISGGVIELSSLPKHIHQPVRRLGRCVEVDLIPNRPGDLARTEFAALPAPRSTATTTATFTRQLGRAFGTNPLVALVMITDLWRKDRFNVPGTASSNWSHGENGERFEQNRSVRKRMRLIRELEKTGRLSSTVPPSRDEGSHIARQITQ